MKLMILGATGLVGEYVLQQALLNPTISQIIVPVRKPLALDYEKLQVVEVDFEYLPEDDAFWQVDAVISALGSTMKKAGSKAAFRHVDYDYPLIFAKKAQQHGAKSFALNSAMGASANSPIFYSKVKGELEQALTDLNFESLTLVRPGIIAGERQESRPAEQWTLNILEKIKPILPKVLQPSPAQNIAKALLKSVVEAKPGVHIISASELAE
ncbi:hypothetical protein GCM10023206_12710 [Acinetobacter puyangensis]|uniref:Uncharacterized conserved protein YbjT, contains NAD(P)-binding and DUF2867 domains n=1 Tax=Acinetobacter puyangensis TaxID=1096779 RepID=A0A240EDQ7_9GAMM|nr:NAD(P)H-binding protein [Acinetobacter puyangensis]SNX46691.1 Uncharacterized conserved protein YbjT, contains NAD(P)-binding and DUF2867 domains [Acinetobacter puyangensis]